MENCGIIVERRWLVWIMMHERGWKWEPMMVDMTMPYQHIVGYKFLRPRTIF